MELETGKVYRVKHTSGMIEWKFQNMAEYGAIGSGRRGKRYYGKNLKTGKQIVLKSTQKIKGIVE